MALELSPIREKKLLTPALEQSTDEPERVMFYDVIGQAFFPHCSCSSSLKLAV